ncbi:MAG: hypothetical protein K0U19_06925 [Proteobacteria bacterium]|nr:hypothetical protein [Pseudomonadota bacterium]
MNSIKNLPLSFTKKIGLLISDSDVELISWKKGEIIRIAIFSNDELGLGRFVSYLQKNKDEYKNASFRILANIIGEDYRVEKVAHLIGKYKLDFHHRRMDQLFRGISLCMSMVQGREDRGRREDIVLFYGMLTETKVLPWMNAIIKNPDYYLEGVHAVSFVNLELLKSINSSWRKQSSLLMTIHEKGLLRQTHYDKGDVRFSRVSKISDENAEEVAVAIRKELERTIQYLNSLKISLAQGLDIHFICPAAMVGQLKELVKGSEKIRFNFHDASAVAQKIGLTTALGELGHDSSLSLQKMFTNIWFKQLAKFNQVRYYWLKTFSAVVAMVFAAYGAYGLWNLSFVAAEGLSLRGDTQDLIGQRDEVRRGYNEQFGQLEDPPSSAANISAVSQTFQVLSNINIIPGQLIYYFANAYEKNKRLQISNMRWYVTGDPSRNDSNSFALIEGGDIYQVLEVKGEFLSVPNETYIDVADRADILINSFEARDDVEVVAVDLPRRDLVKQNLGGVLTEDYSVDAARSRTFHLRVIWKRYDEQRISDISKRKV